MKSEGSSAKSRRLGRKTTVTFRQGPHKFKMLKEQAPSSRSSYLVTQQFMESGSFKGY